MLTNKEIEAIRKRAEKASDGWIAVDGIYVASLDDDGNEIVIAECDTEDNAYFIGEARQDIPKLLAEIDRLKKIVAWSVSCVICVNQLGEGWKYDGNYGELICDECFENRYGGDRE